MTTLPNPLTPPDCDLAGYRWMPLDVERVIDSDTFGLSTGEEFKTAFRLWAKSWKQVPAASLPDDDRLLAHLAGLEVAAWRKRKEVALRGWILCSDGRLYHPVIAEKALEAMGRRGQHTEREENEQSRQQRYRERRKALFETLREHGIVPSKDTKTDELERLIASLEASPSVTENVTGDVTHNVTHDISEVYTATAIEKEKEKEKEKDITKTKEEQVVVHTPPSEETPAPLPEIVPNSRGAAISLLMRRNGIEGCNAANPIVDEWSKDQRVTDDVLLTAAGMAKARDVARPGPNYLAPIVEQLLNPKPAKPKADDWHRSEAGIKRKAKELGVAARAGWGYDQLKDAVWDAIRTRERQGVAA